MKPDGNAGAVAPASESVLFPHRPDVRGNSGRKRNQKWVFILGSISVNFFLFFILAGLNRPSSDRPAHENWKAIELLQVELPPVKEEIVKQTEMIASEDHPTTEPEEMIEDLVEDMREHRLNPRLPDLPGLSVELVRAPVVRSVGSRGIQGVLNLARVDRPPEKISSPFPDYPYWARMRGKEGFVELAFIVGSDGNVQHVEVKRVEGDERFGEAARKAIEHWKFRPALLDGSPVAVWCNQRIYFKLED